MNYSATAAGKSAVSDDRPDWTEADRLLLADHAVRTRPVEVAHLVYLYVRRYPGVGHEKVASYAEAQGVDDPWQTVRALDTLTKIGLIDATE